MPFGGAKLAWERASMRPKHVLSSAALVPVALALLLALAFPASPLSAEEVTRQQRRWTLGEGKVLTLDFPVGEVTVSPHKRGDEVRLELVVECVGRLNLCETTARQLELSGQETEEGLTVRLEAGKLPFTRDRRRAKTSWARVSPLYGERPGSDVQYAPGVRTPAMLYQAPLPERYPEGYALRAKVNVVYPAHAGLLDIRVDHGLVDLVSLSTDARVRTVRGNVLVGSLQSLIGRVDVATRDSEVAVVPDSGQVVRGEQAGSRGGRELHWTGAGEHGLDVEVEEKGLVRVRLYAGPDGAS